MSSPAESRYFPSLDKCLAGGERLVTWRAAYRALCDEKLATSNGHLEQFLNDDQSIHLLASALDPFSGPSHRAGQDFETKTAPINISQAANDEYNLSELKDDAKWLARELQIEELSALRIAIIELQERPADQLLGSLSSSDTALVSSANSTLLLTSTAHGTASSTPLPASIDFSRKEIRQERLLSVYASEKAHIQRLSADLMGRYVTREEEETETRHHAQRAGAPRSWIDNLAANVVRRMTSNEATGGVEAFCMKGIRSVDRLLQTSEDRSLWPAVFHTEDGRQSIFARSQHEALTNTLRLLLASIHALDETPQPSTLQAWFTLMDRHDFLYESRPLFVTVDPTNTQYLISIISLGILKLPLVVANLLKVANTDGLKQHPKLYLNNEECVHFMNTIFHRFATFHVKVAALAIYGWSIVTGLIRDIAKSRRAMREGLVESADDEHETFIPSARRGSRENISGFENLYDFLSSHDLGEARDDPPRFFATVTVDKMQVFSLIANLSVALDSVYGLPAESATALISKDVMLDAIREGMHFVEYGAEVLEAVLSVLLPDNVKESTREQARILGAKFMADGRLLRPSILEQAIARYPYELSPLLRLCRVLAGAKSKGHSHGGPLEIVQWLDKLRSMTQMVPEDFRSYQLDHEDENTNTMMLTDALPIFTDKQNLTTSRNKLLLQRSVWGDTDAAADQKRILSIPAGTPGALVKETRPFVLKLEYAHSGLEYAGVLLSTFQANGELEPVAPGGALDRFTAAELISLVSALLNATLRQQRSRDEALFVIGRFGYALANEQDIISVVADIFEAELLAHLDQVAGDGSLELLIACAEFLALLVDVAPERTWSILARSSLLGVSGSAVSLASVVGGTETQTGHYRFLTACIKLHNKLLEDAVAGLVKRKAGGAKTNNRFDSPMESMDSIPDRTISSVIGAFQKVLLDAFQNLPSWRFETPQERSDIVATMMNGFTTLFRSTYGIGVGKPTSVQLAGVLVPAAESLLELCAPYDGASALISTCSKLILDGLALTNDNIVGNSRLSLIEQTKSIISFLAILLRAARYYSQSPVKPAENQLKSTSGTGGGDPQGRARHVAVDLLKVMPTFAVLLASDHALKASLFTLLAELVQAINVSDVDPPSILSQLNAETARSFLQIVVELDRPLCDPNVERHAWNFLAAILSNKQQWFAIYLLTGTLPKSRAKNGENAGSKPKSLLTYALDQLSDVAKLSPERAASMLRFIAHAQQTWVWATNEVRSHPNFLKSTLAWIEKIEAPSREPNPAAAIISAREYEMAAYLCDILAIVVQASLEIGDNTVLKMITPKLGFLRDNGLIVNTYNRSLHKNLAENMKRKFPYSELSDFQRTKVDPAPFGTEYFYDRIFAASVLRHNLAWEGADKQRNHGFSSEFSRANINLSLYDAQIRLLRSWKALAITLCECADHDAALQAELAQVAERCLTANTNAQLDEPYAADLLKLRIELAFVLSSRLVSLRVASDSIKDLLPACWELVKASPVSYDISTAPEDMQYYRSMLQVLYLAIQPHQYLNTLQKAPQANNNAVVKYLAPNIASCLVDVMGKIIAPGFRALCANLHTDMQHALPADFALLTALLQAVLSVPGVSSVHTLISDLVAGSLVLRSALSLFSWADQLAQAMGQDPVYGEMAVMFLSVLSTVRPIAEQMALEGVLTQLSSANLSNYFRKPGGKGPFDEPQRMFAIWTEGFLPLCLNLLDAVGPPIASEVASFLNSFPEQLRRAEKALQNAAPSPRNRQAGAITMSLVSEAHDLTMIAAILSSDIACGAAEGIDAADISPLQFDAEGVQDLASALLRSKRSLADRIVAAGPLEARWQRSVLSGTNEDLLMARIVKELSNMQECLRGDLP